MTKVDDVKTRNAYVLLRAGSGGLDSRMSVCRAVMQRNCEQYSGQTAAAAAVVAAAAVHGGGCCSMS